MNFGPSISHCLRHYAGFEGRASRSEFWWFFLFQVLVLLVASVLSEVLYMVVSLGLLLPALAVGARRLHDIGKSGWWQLLYLIPLFGWLVMLYFLVQPSMPQGNAYGAGPATGVSIDLAPGQQ